MKQKLILLALTPVLGIGMVLVLPVYLFSIITNQDKGWKIAVAVDELCKVACNGSLNRTISYRAAVSRNQGRIWGCVLCRFLDWLDPGHCDAALKDPEQDGGV